MVARASRLETEVLHTHAVQEKLAVTTCFAQHLLANTTGIWIDGICFSSQWF